MAKSTRETVSQYVSSSRRNAQTRKISKYRKGPGIEVLKQRLSTTFPFTTRFSTTFDYMSEASDPIRDHLKDPLDLAHDEVHRNRILPVGNPFTDLNHSTGETTTELPTAGGKLRNVFSIIDSNRNEESALRRLRNEVRMRDVIPLLAYSYATGSFVCGNRPHCKEREVDIYCIGLLGSTSEIRYFICIC